MVLRTIHAAVIRAALGAAVGLGMTLGAPALAQPLTTALTYQGTLTDSGAPASGQYDLRFRLYTAASGGSQVGPQLCANDVAVSNGQFTVSLDFGAQFNGQQRFLEIDARAGAVGDCSNSSGYTTLAPRQGLTATPNAAFALNAQTFNGQPPAFYLSASNLTGTLPASALAGSYGGALSLTNAGNTIVGSGAGLTLLNATSVSSGTLADARLTPNVALRNAANAFGNVNNTFAGSVGIGTTTPTTRLHVEESAAGAVALSAYATSGVALNESIAGYFEANSNAGTALYALATANGGTTYGLQAFTDSSGANAMAVRGEALRSPSAGAAAGVFGVYGVASSVNPNSFGVFANGRLGASGTKSFVIDHPLDPANRVLYHYSAESPEVLNIYSGTVRADAAGEAVVALPAYFEAINTDPRYTLTSVGAPAPMLHVAEEIRDGRFRIAGAAPNSKVCWEVKGVRHDRFVERYGAPVEMDKAPENRGTYITPELFNQGADRAQFRGAAR